MQGVGLSVEAGDFAGAAGILATLRKPLDAFFEATTVNDPDPALRGNRLRLLSSVKRSMDLVADFSQVEG
jgi:glycyl-tRNA synthetase beta chain